MADYNSAYTGAQVDAAVAKSQGIPAAAAITEAVEPAAASAGDVWTADGQGGATWAAPSGGSGKYAHFVYLNWTSNFYMFTIVINDVSTAYTTFSDFRTAFKNAYGTRWVPATGCDVTNSYRPIWGAYISSQDEFNAIFGGNSGRRLDGIGLSSVYDNVVAL